MDLNWKNHISSDEKVLMGKPVIKDTRISVELLLELYAQGWKEKQILESYPSLTLDDIRAVYLYLKDCSGQELFFPVKKAI